MTTERPMGRPPQTVSAADFLEDLAGPLTLGAALAALRAGEGLSLSRFAQELGMSRSNLSDIEHGRRRVSAAKAAELAHTLGHPVEVFVQLAIQDQLRAAGLEYEVTLQTAS